MQFTDEQKSELLGYARQVLVHIVKDGKKVEQDCPDSNYLESAGVFVSLHKGKELRGCIGYIEPVSSIWDAIADNAVASATRDVRFLEVSVEELDEIKIEISILTPAKECQLEDIEAGKHGVIIQQGPHKATYLPQVWESLSSKEKFLGTLCQKAGLGETCWTDKSTKFYKYEAIVFSENSQGGTV
ncbi:AmmeMemoRadiSam system protein A [Candidatus Falkowbacteria bacterium]|mgnify:CR=1 FL=1|jgi:uncharacterized protein|nr:AmmeMemoRadiSam system protein A [Candidatus Falkowbacteria bacterium]MBT6573504.1 AmmeMemoRadiSam system protein A [Candidatus Falkowbacteria bacterium]MBT7348054.1 AmmeMemoRadiSam system protein A [Candidatus Falkowbacteria bacterium]MBT7501111.1 AmmeMemoRadiSam system protein A [Candidatus Falkowbacteria bacterium]